MPFFILKYHRTPFPFDNLNNKSVSNKFIFLSGSKANEHFQTTSSLRRVKKYNKIKVNTVQPEPEKGMKKWFLGVCFLKM